MKLVLDCLHLVWIAALLGGFSGGWGALLVRRLRLPPSLVLPIGFAVFAAGAYVVFFAFLAAPWLGRPVAWLWGAASIAVLVHEWRSAPGRALLRSRDAWLPGALLFLLAGAYLALLFAGHEPPARRFTWELPIDDQIPMVFADRLAAGESPTPLVGDWLSSDRPPLQAGLELAIRPWHLRHRAGINYQFLGTLLQMLWLPALFALGRIVGLTGRQLGFVLLCCATSGFFLVNSLYVWPKLLAAALTLTAFAVILAAVRDGTATPAHAGLAAGCAALGLLAHGGVAFSLLALPALPAAWVFLGRVGWRGLAAAMLTFGASYSPWTAYQTLCDPPGNRLLKWHLAGQIAIDDRGFLQTLRENYRTRPPDAARFARAMNRRAVFFYPGERLETEDARAYLRRAQFFGHLSTLALLPLGWLTAVAVLVFRRQTLPAFSSGLLLHSTVALVGWMLLMFLPGNAVIHQGSYAVTMLLFLLCGVGLTRWPAPWRWGLFAFHLAAFGWVWLLNSPGRLPAPLAPIEAAIAACCGAAFVALLWAIPAEAPESA